MKKRIIWSNRDIDYDQWKEDLIQYNKEMGYNNPEDVHAKDVFHFVDESLSNYLDDERMNLNVETEGRIIAIADVGLWNGRVQGYRILGKNVNEIFQIHEDYNEYYSDGHNIKATCIHHDGTNYIEYRVIREDKNIDNLFDGTEITRKRLNYYTKSLLPYVKKVYGW